MRGFSSIAWPSMSSSACARLVELARSVDADPANIGVLSTGEACAVALLLGRGRVADLVEIVVARSPVDSG
jgi:hypothetical protein